MYNYLLSDAIIRVKNAQMVKKIYTEIYFSKLVETVMNLLVKQGYITKTVRVYTKKKIPKIQVFLKYSGILSVPAIKEIEIISNSGKEKFKSYRNINSYYGGLGILILSTSQGIMTDNKARNIKIGGEILCNIL
jgi:small subunit ribosomal protein S8